MHNKPAYAICSSNFQYGNKRFRLLVTGECNLTRTRGAEGCPRLQNDRRPGMYPCRSLNKWPIVRRSIVPLSHMFVAQKHADWLSSLGEPMKSLLWGVKRQTVDSVGTPSAGRYAEGLASSKHTDLPTRDQESLFLRRGYLAPLRWTTMVPATMSYTVLLCWKKRSVMKTGKRNAMEKFLFRARTAELRRTNEKKPD
ncbi:hypothetical protein EYF80_003857 [Liparis tanakae]|uniref:Uncharacterized protein n=1 Tax=Liparis tanakae TaxID=230148 RepID=A0A4Z2J8L8_9TELE|nr:hypothetical protein EYF80_003857 [Liparis tanakae]